MSRSHPWPRRFGIGAQRGWLMGLGICVVLVTVGCGSGGEGDWSAAGVTSLYAAALEVVREEWSHEERGCRGESLQVDEGTPCIVAVHPQPRFVFEAEGGGLEMGDFNRWGDPDFNRAIGGDSLVVACTLDGERGCSPDRHSEFVVMSEVIPVHQREAVVMAVHVDRTSGLGSSQRMILHFRFGSGEWRLSRMSKDGGGGPESPR